MPNLTRIELDPDRAPWDRQPGESQRRYDAFRVYLELGRGRTLAKAAHQLGKNADYVRHLAATGQWQTRIRAWNEHLDAVYQARFIERAQQAAEEDASLLRTAMEHVSDAVAAHRESGEPLSPDQAIRWMDIVLKYRRQLYGDPTTATERSQQATDQQPPMQVEVKHFAELPDEGKLNALRHLMAENERWLAAASDQDDE